MYKAEHKKKLFWGFATVCVYEWCVSNVLQCCKVFLFGFQGYCTVRLGHALTTARV